ncbi:MAG: PilZ domain-containing protein [Deltaproteobacteria bacterium]|nr:PilZ domain-containing protein [Deltaproteobacteria bacterium]
METEKRQHPRYSVRNVGVEIFSRENKLIGKLENISKSGLAFCYTPVGDEKAESDTIDVIATGPARFYLSGLDCRKVYDISTLAEDQNFTGDETRLCGMEFVRLESNHRLAFFLRNYLNLAVDEPI